ncbi:hypothetical protein LTR22_028362 [Elasticomyces elasticus]|uniref:Uncharacterized protein n=1 Tax=Elasticomyces elasticus TaxID=574655 RepID=A0AAN7VXM2_9PEZI|nr:hypothetical protein LTR22_028362 [Elasticomyces elasticus]KAK5689294.1 hypothetical protein LTR97_012922 [Elasticomyces elasticus]
MTKPGPKKGTAVRKGRKNKIDRNDLKAKVDELFKLIEELKEEKKALEARVAFLELGNLGGGLNDADLGLGGFDFNFNLEEVATNN